MKIPTVALPPRTASFAVIEVNVNSLVQVLPGDGDCRSSESVVLIHYYMAGQSKFGTVDPTVRKL